MKPTKKFKDRYDEYPASDLTKRTAEILSEVQHGRMPVIISKHDKPIAFIAPMSLLDKLESGLLETLEQEGTRIETMTREIRRTTQIAQEAEAKESAPPSSKRGAVHPKHREETKTMAVAVPRKARP